MANASVPTRATALARLAAGLAALVAGDAAPARAALPGGTLDPTTIPKYEASLVVPPAMPRTAVLSQPGGKKTDSYEIALRQFEQQILPPGMPATTVWSYGSLSMPGTAAQGGSFHYPAFTIEAKWRQAVRVKWVNDLVDANGDFLPHLLPVDQTLHWANPPGECLEGPPRPDCEGASQEPYTGPVPMVVHLHGGASTQENDGFPEAWYLPAANDIQVPFTTGTRYESFRALSPLGALWEPGTAVFEYGNDQAAATIWYHDHSLGMTRQNVYAGPAGFYLLRGGPSDAVVGTLPGPAPALGDPPGTPYYEIPIAIQDRSFDADGSLFYPDNRLLRGTRAGSAPDPLPARPRRLRAERRAADLEPRVLREHDRGERPHVALPRRRAAPLPPALTERQPVALPDPAHGGRPQLLADRRGRGLPPGARVAR